MDNLITVWCKGSSRTAIKLKHHEYLFDNPYFDTGQCAFCTRSGIRVTLDKRIYRHVDIRPYGINSARTKQLQNIV